MMFFKRTVPRTQLKNRGCVNNRSLGFFGSVFGGGAARSCESNSVPELRVARSRVTQYQPAYPPALLHDDVFGDLSCRLSCRSRDIPVNLL
jgi:hypothetical protein